MATKQRRDIVADFRPVSVKDTAVKTGKAVNPVGSIIRRPELDDVYTPPPAPVRAADRGGEAGGTGGFGATLPRPTQPNIIDRAVNWLGQNLPGLSGQAGAWMKSTIPAVLNSFLPSSFVPIPLQGFYPQNQPAQRTVTNQPGFNPAVPTLVQTPVVPSLVQTPVSPSQRGTPQPTSNIWRPDGRQKDDVYSPSAQQPSTAAMMPPAAEITAENYGDWVDYWNWQAQNPLLVRAQVQAEAEAKGKPDPFAPVVMTREQIWQMKATSRRRNMEEEATSGGYPPVNVPVNVSGEPAGFGGYTGYFYSTQINTGSG